MRKNTTLVIMAAGIGNRFGEGIKQLTPFGPSGEIIMDYSIHDAIEAGFDQVVFVTRKEIYQDFKEIIGDRVAKIIPVSYAFQDMSDLPSGYTVPEGRKKPWGTGQAILACKDIVKNPFAVLNADDYYGKDAFHKVHEYLVNQEETTDGKYHFCMAGFVLKNTLSDHGGVTRGICRVSPSGELLSIRETHGIVKTAEGAAVSGADGSLAPLDAESLVSMNFWGFTVCSGNTAWISLCFHLRITGLVLPTRRMSRLCARHFMHWWSREYIRRRCFTKISLYKQEHF